MRTGAGGGPGPAVAASGGGSSSSAGGGGSPPGGAGGSGGGGSSGGGGAAADSAVSRYDAARACAITGDHGCVIAQLRGHSTTPREFELLIASMRSSSGYDRDVESTMRTYLARFPTGRQVGVYRQYLVAHSGG